MTAGACDICNAQNVEITHGYVSGIETFYCAEGCVRGCSCGVYCQDLGPSGGCRYLHAVRNVPKIEVKMNTAEQLAGLIMNADLPKRLMAENAKLRAVLLECKHGAEYPDTLGDMIDAALGLSSATEVKAPQRPQWECPKCGEHLYQDVVDEGSWVCPYPKRDCPKPPATR